MNKVDTFEQPDLGVELIFFSLKSVQGNGHYNPGKKNVCLRHLLISTSHKKISILVIRNTLVFIIFKNAKQWRIQPVLQSVVLNTVRK